MSPVPDSNELLQHLRELIESARTRTSVAINAEMTALYWQVGKYLGQYVLESKRGAYGKRTVRELAKMLTAEYGPGWSTQQLRHCLRFAETFPDESIVSALRRQLSWTHLKTLIYLDDPLKRDFYRQLCVTESWSTRQLRERIDSMLYERTAISKAPEETIAADLKQMETSGTVTQDLAFRDPYVLDFLGLGDRYTEEELESAILVELQQMLIELGTDFTFVSRQKRLTIDQRDYYIDLLLFHRRLQALVAVELKIGDFKAEYKGQMELYLGYLDKYERLENEQPPIGLILCTGKNQEHVELMRLNESNIRVAEYLTKLPSREVLERKLHQSIEIAREKVLKLNDERESSDE